MKAKNLETAEDSRRIFLNKSLFTGVGAFLGLFPFKRVDASSRGTVKMLTSEGKLVEVEKKYLPPKRGKRITNRELLEWITNIKK